MVIKKFDISKLELKKSNWKSKMLGTTILFFIAQKNGLPTNI